MVRHALGRALQDIGGINLRETEMVSLESLTSLRTRPVSFWVPLYGVLQVDACSFCLCSETFGCEPGLNRHPVAVVNSVKRWNPLVLIWH